MGSSPHTRGAHAVHRDHDFDRGIIPAYAGSTCCRLSRSSSRRDHPRIRGEHLIDCRLDEARPGSSPHTRGALEVFDLARQHTGIIPAYAGSTRATCSRATPRRDHPRIRGEHEHGTILYTFLTGSSPHTRGAPEELGFNLGVAGIIPAYAGSTSYRPSSAGCRRDHPRIRGKHVDFDGVLCRDEGSSPHTRGALIAVKNKSVFKGIIPAYAGSTWRPPRPTAPGRDHPRIRGEHWAVFNLLAAVLGSSPHTRGAPRTRRRLAIHPGIIPAYAGSTLALAALQHVSRDHPRIRGEHKNGCTDSIVVPGSSPHTRGALIVKATEGLGYGIIPAYAGSTWQFCSDGRVGRDHPRIRGEHISVE